MKLIKIALPLICLCCKPEAQITQLFNGEDLSGWYADVPAMDTTSIGSPFLVRDGLLVSMGDPRGHLITEQS